MFILKSHLEITLELYTKDPFVFLSAKACCHLLSYLSAKRCRFFVKLTAKSSHVNSKLAYFVQLRQLKIVPIMAVLFGIFVNTCLLKLIMLFSFAHLSHRECYNW